LSSLRRIRVQKNQNAKDSRIDELTAEIAEIAEK
jgi:hypothetical protein